jgi:hypothetical protein
MTKWYILRPFGTFCDHLAFFSRSGILYREKSGNPDWHALRHAFKLQQIGAIIKSHAQFFGKIPLTHSKSGKRVV